MDPSANVYNILEDMDSSANPYATNAELNVLIDFIQATVSRVGPVRPDPIITSIPRQPVLIPEAGETILMPLAVQGLMSLMESIPDRSSRREWNSFINAVNEGATPYKNVLSEQGTDALRTVEFREIAESAPNKECPIFQTEFEETQLVTQLPCKHCFEPDAIKHWLTTEQAVCPICRYELPSKEIRVENEEEIISPQARNSQITTRSVTVDPEEEALRLALLASLQDYNNTERDT